MFIPETILDKCSASFLYPNSLSLFASSISLFLLNSDIRKSSDIFLLFWLLIFPPEFVTILDKFLFSSLYPNSLRLLVSWPFKYANCFLLLASSNFCLFAAITRILILSPIWYTFFVFSPINVLLSSSYIKYSLPRLSNLINPSTVFSSSTNIPNDVTLEIIPLYSSPILFCIYSAFFTSSASLSTFCAIFSHSDDCSAYFSACPIYFS